MTSGNYLSDLTDRFRSDLALNRRDDLIFEGNTVTENESPTGPKVVNVDFLAKANAVNHHCEKYEIVDRRQGSAIIRRGGTFNLEVEFSVKPELKATHEVKFYFSFGQYPSVHKGTQAQLVVSDKEVFNKSHGEWDVRVVEENGAKVTFEIQVPTHAPVGVWKPAVEIGLRSASEPSRHLFRSNTLLYILFNPWNKDDGTYIANDERRNEYVLADVGKIWVGTHPHTHGRHWVFGQFDDAVLPACILLLERSGLAPEARGDPIRVSRVISKMVNDFDDNGVIIGNWSGDYQDGTSPLTWTGSINILEEYVRTNQPVRYGQCWVFAGVVNTVCRALGLPCRVVSNFSSAHDTNSSLTIDEYYDEEGIKIPSWFGGPHTPGIFDSVWNFHVWNDVWMTRPDLPEGYSGWQAIDGTPQEYSDGSFQLGPAPLQAIRQGHRVHQYDVTFVQAEVNADVVYWQKSSQEPFSFKKIGTNTTGVGKQVLTKKPGPIVDSGYSEEDMEDITNEYKHLEGTEAERESLLTGVGGDISIRFGPRPAEPEAVADVEFTFEELERVPIGKDFMVNMTAKNTSVEQRTVSVIVTCSSVYYTGIAANSIKRLERVVELAPGEAKTTALHVTYEEYYEKLVEHAMVRNVAICHVKETTLAWVGEAALEIQKPDIEIEVLDKAVATQPLNIRFSFVNPLPISLKNCKLMVDGPGLVRPKLINIYNVAPNDRMTYVMTLHPKKRNQVTMVATFNSTQLVNLSGSKQIDIKSTV